MPKGIPNPKTLHLIPKTPPPAWERQPGETDKAFEAFCCYRDMSQDQRNQKLVANRLNKSVGLIAQWSIKYRWQDRISAYQDFLDRKSIEAKLESIKKMHEEDRERERLLGLTLIGHATKRLQDEKRPVRIADAHIPQWVKQGVELVRISDGLAANKSGLIIEGNPDGAPIQVAHSYVLVDGIKPPMKEIAESNPQQNAPIDNNEWQKSSKSKSKQKEPKL